VIWARGIIGAVLCVTGIVWIGQGAGVIGGSFMTGEVQWTLFGVIALIIGLALISLARRARRGAQDAG
jgi:membrane protein implicated in regulation of membrane protease activity